MSAKEDRQNKKTKKGQLMNQVAFDMLWILLVFISYVSISFASLIFNDLFMICRFLAL